MSYYPELKQRLTCREVAPRNGLKVNAAGMALCPFHGERSPSLKLSRSFYCFGCGAQGDVITFVSRLFGISIRDAARKLSVDFEIPLDDHHPPNPKTEISKWRSYTKHGSGSFRLKHQEVSGIRCLPRRCKSRRISGRCFLNWSSEPHRRSKWFMNITERR